MAAGERITVVTKDSTRNLNECSNGQDGENHDIEYLKQSLKEGINNSINKISFLQKEVGEKQISLDKERDMKLQAEREISLLSMDGVRGNSTPDAPKFMKRHASKVNQVVNTNALFEEVKTARLLNKTLTEKLCQVEQDRDALIRSKENMRLELSATYTARGAALVDKIYAAQRDREEALKHRLNILDDDKEELNKHVRRMENDKIVDTDVESNYYGEGICKNSHMMNFAEIADRLCSANHLKAIEFNGELIVDRYKSHNKKGSSAEFKKLKEERDAALLQVNQLKDELKSVQRERNLFEMQHRKNEKNRFKAIQNQLKGVIKERDDAEENYRTVNAELEQLSLKYSELQHSHKVNDCLDECKSKLRRRDEALAEAQKSNDELQRKLKDNISDKNRMELEVEELKEEKRQNQILQRTIKALERRKER